MFELKIENKDGNILTLTQNEGNYQVVEIDGLNPPNANIISSPVATMDGAKFNSSKLETRNIVLTIKINGDVENNRLKLYRYFKTKEWCKLYYKNGSRDVFIEGYVETFEVGLFELGETAQISIICPYPYFKDVDMIVVDMLNSISQFKFPFSINKDEPIPISSYKSEAVVNLKNTSESETGVIIKGMFYGDINKLEIRNITNGESFIINYPFIEGDELTINCNRGSRSVELRRNLIGYNLIPNIQRGSTFFQLGAGDNLFGFLADEGASDYLISITFEYYNVFRGV